MTGHGIWAAVCVKSLGAAKQRLAPILTPEQRRRLVLAMLREVLAALADTPGLRGTLVISPDPLVRAVSVQAGAVGIAQAGDIGFAASADAAAQAAATIHRATGVMVVPADVPLATPDDFAAVLAAGRAGGMTIVPAWDGRGSNCVLLSPPIAIRFCFGPDSFRRHLAAAEAIGIPARTLHNGRLARDIDTPADLSHAAHLSGGLSLPRLRCAALTPNSAGVA